MKIVKSRKFNNAYIIKDKVFATEHSEVLYNDSTKHLFLKEVKDNMEVPYVFYSKRYKKWYKDIAYIPINIFNKLSF